MSGSGQGITGASVPRTPLSAVQRLEQRVAEQSPPSVGSPEWSRGAAQVKRQQQERVRDNEALREAASSPGRSSSTAVTATAVVRTFGATAAAAAAEVKGCKEEWRADTRGRRQQRRERRRQQLRSQVVLREDLTGVFLLRFR